VAIYAYEFRLDWKVHSDPGFPHQQKKNEQRAISEKSTLTPVFLWPTLTPVWKENEPDPFFSTIGYIPPAEAEANSYRQLASLPATVVAW